MVKVLFVGYKKTPLFLFVYILCIYFLYFFYFTRHSPQRPAGRPPAQGKSTFVTYACWLTRWTRCTDWSAGTSSVARAGSPTSRSWS